MEGRARAWPWPPMRARARHEVVVIGREIKKRENLVFTESSTIRENFVPAKMSHYTVY